MTDAHALLLTDVVHSTRLSEQLGDAAMARVWAAHDRVARDLLRVHDGREIDKTDGFLLLFARATDAVAYALAYHRAIAALDPPLKARAGLHVGPVILTANAPDDVARGAKPLEVDGLAKPTAARVMSVAVGGQTLLTVEAREALGPTPLRVVSHGRWRMKGLAEPIELFEVGEAGSPFVPPPDAAKAYRVVLQADLWLPVKDVAHNLPAERDVFVGRDADLRDLGERLDGGARLVSVIGIGGTGKTRLLTRFAWTWLGDFPGGAWFCDLSEARDAAGIVGAVARALDVPLGKEEPIAQLGHAFASRGRCLVVLDNFEQVARHAAETVGRWLDRAPLAAFVVTTREVLGLPGEQALALAPLPESDGARLFQARALAAKRDFVATDADRPAIEGLVRLLDGLPLAIELAAARVRVMPPKVLLQRMSERFKLLTSTGGRATRQATLRSTLDWSWDLLTADEQAALAQLSVFQGGFTLEAAEAVLSLAELWPTDAVQGLVDKSLVRRVTDERFDLLVSVQEYAAERLDAAARRDAEGRHGTHYAALGDRAALDALFRHGGSARFGDLAREVDNLTVACRRAVARSDAEVAVATLAAAWEVLLLRGPFAAALELAGAVAGMPDLGRQERAEVTRVQGAALLSLGRIDEALAAYQRALATYRELGDRRLEAVVLGNLGLVLALRGRTEEARARLEAALAEHLALGDGLHESFVRANYGNLLVELGRVGEARTQIEAGLAACRARGDRRTEGSLLSHLANVSLQLGLPDEAQRHLEGALVRFREVGDHRLESLAIASLSNSLALRGRLDEALAASAAAIETQRAIGDRRAEGITLCNQGGTLAKLGRFDDARARYEEALGVLREVGDRRFEGVTLCNLGFVHLDLGRREEARPHFEASLGVFREIGDRRNQGVVLGRLGDLDVERGRHDEALAAYDAAEALLREVGHGTHLARLQCARARLLHLLGRAEDARAALADAEALVAAAHATAASPLQPELAAARAALGAARPPPPDVVDKGEVS